MRQYNAPVSAGLKYDSSQQPHPDDEDGLPAGAAKEQQQKKNIWRLRRAHVNTQDAFAICTCCSSVLASSYKAPAPCVMKQHSPMACPHVHHAHKYITCQLHGYTYTGSFIKDAYGCCRYLPLALTARSTSGVSLCSERRTHAHTETHRQFDRPIITGKQCLNANNVLMRHIFIMTNESNVAKARLDVICGVIHCTKEPTLTRTDGPKCGCNEVMQLKTSNSANNPGRQFYACGKMRDVSSGRGEAGMGALPSVATTLGCPLVLTGFGRRVSSRRPPPTAVCLCLAHPRLFLFCQGCCFCPERLDLPIEAIYLSSAAMYHCRSCAGSHALRLLQLGGPATEATAATWSFRRR